MFSWFKKKKYTEDVWAKSSLSRIYDHHTDLPATNQNVYPQIIHVASQDIHAVTLYFSVRTTDVERLGQSIVRFFPAFNVSDPLGRTFLQHGMSALHVILTPEFNSVVVEIITNCMPLVQSIHDGVFAPPYPWEVFAVFVPEDLGFLQGNQDYWWGRFWQPYWQSLSSERRAASLAMNTTIPPEWKAFLLTEDHN
jgi:hypothetical protein